MSRSSLMLSRYVRRVLPTGGFMFVIGLNFLNFLKDSVVSHVIRNDWCFCCVGSSDACYRHSFLSAFLMLMSSCFQRM